MATQNKRSKNTNSLTRNIQSTYTLKIAYTIHHGATKQKINEFQFFNTQHFRFHKSQIMLTNKIGATWNYQRSRTQKNNRPKITHRPVYIIREIGSILTNSASIQSSNRRPVQYSFTDDQNKKRKKISLECNQLDKTIKRNLSLE